MEDCISLLITKRLVGVAIAHKWHLQRLCYLSVLEKVSVQRGFCPGGVSVQGLSVQGVSVQWSLCLGGSLSQGGLCPGPLCPGGLCPVESLSGGSLSREGVSTVMWGWYASYWNAFLLNLNSLHSGEGSLNFSQTDNRHQRRLKRETVRGTTKMTNFVPIFQKSITIPAQISAFFCNSTVCTGVLPRIFHMHAIHRLYSNLHDDCDATIYYIDDQPGME